MSHQQTICFSDWGKLVQWRDNRNLCIWSSLMQYVAWYAVRLWSVCRLLDSQLGQKFSPLDEHRLWTPRIHLFSGHRGNLGRDVDNFSPSSVEIKGVCVELYVHLTYVFMLLSEMNTVPFYRLPVITHYSEKVKWTKRSRGGCTAVLIVEVTGLNTSPAAMKILVVFVVL